MGVTSTATVLAGLGAVHAAAISGAFMPGMGHSGNANAALPPKPEHVTLAPGPDCPSCTTTELLSPIKPPPQIRNPASPAVSTTSSSKSMYQDGTYWKPLVGDYSFNTYYTK